MRLRCHILTADTGGSYGRWRQQGAEGLIQAKAADGSGRRQLRAVAPEGSGGSRYGQRLRKGAEGGSYGRWRRKGAEGVDTGKGCGRERKEAVTGGGAGRERREEHLRLLCLEHEARDKSDKRGRRRQASAWRGRCRHREAVPPEHA